MKETDRWIMPDWTFVQVEDHGFSAHEGHPLYAYGPTKAEPFRTGELYESLDRAMVAAVAEKYSGRRGAGGTGVGTAADWFFRMTGMDELVAVDHGAGQKVMAEVIVAAGDGTVFLKSQAMVAELEERGLVLAAMNHGR